MIWDVDRVVLLTKDLPRVEIPLAAIRELDEPIWFDASDSPPACRTVIEHARLIKADDLSYPVILSAEGRVMDGMHRVAKALKAGHLDIEAVQFTTDPPPDYLNVKPADLPY